jgi:hypothetical protein
MSRPPNQYVSNQYSDPRYHPGETIDFKVQAMGNPYQGDPSEYRSDFHPGAIYAQAGFPGYAQPNQQLNAGYYMAQQGSQAGPQIQTQFQGYPYPQVSSQAMQYQGYPSHPQPIASPACLPQSAYSTALDSEAIKERIQNNIDAIMETQKTAMLNSKLETLTNKVQSLAQNFESSESSNVRSLSEKVERLSKNLSEGDSASHIKSLSEKVERLSRNIESRRPMEAAESLASASDNDIARKLRRLAAESSASNGRPEERIPDW